MIYVKLGFYLALAAGLIGLGYHFGALKGAAQADSARTALEGFQAAQAQNTAKAVLAERAAGQAELVRVNGILKGYEDAPINPVDLSLSGRLFKYTDATAHAADCPVPKAGPDPAAARDPATKPASDGAVRQATAAVFKACALDAAELSALQAAWPR